MSWRRCCSVWFSIGVAPVGSYFAYWSLAWALQAVALFLVWFYFFHSGLFWLAPYSLLEFSFALALRQRRGWTVGATNRWKNALRPLVGFPVFLAVVYALGLQHRFESFHAVHALVLGGIYLYGAFVLHGSAGGGGAGFPFFVAPPFHRFCHAAVFF